jgi:hypothetical protein
MKTALALIFILLVPQFAISQPRRTGTFEYVQRKGKQTAKLVFKTTRFVESRHKIVIDPRKNLHTIDGRVPLGTDMNTPSIEITSMRFYFDGTEVPVPKHLFSDCYNPGLVDYAAQRFAIRFSDDRQGVYVFMSGSDAAGSYQVIWTLRKDGRHSRFSGACSDCGFIDFGSGFFIGQ